MLIGLVSIKAIVCKNAVAFFIGLFLFARSLGLKGCCIQLNKRLEQEKHSTYCVGFYKYLFCNKSFCCKTPHQ